MGDYPVGSRKNDFQSPPRAFTAAGSPGQVAVLAVSAVAIAVDLSQGISQAATNLTVSGQKQKSVTENYLSIEGDVDLGVIFGPTLASVTGGNVPVIATAGTLTSNKYVGVAGTCWVIKSAAGGGPPTKFLLQPGLDVFVGIVASGAGNVRLYQSSPSEA